MDEISLFEANKLEDSKSQLLFEGREIIVANGEIIEAQFKTDSGQYLLIISDNCPYEDGINFYLFSDDLKILDQLSICQSYTSVQFENVQIIDDSTIEFSFVSEKKNRVKITPKGKRSLIPDIRPYIHRDFKPFAKRYLEVI